MLLDVKNIDVLYDDFQVIWNVSINVNKAEMVALLGPNGSGKSTILNTISNLVHHKNGSIHFNNTLISEIPTHKRTELGISHVLERRRVFPHLTVMQNLLLGAWHPRAKDQLSNSLSKIYKIFPKLEVRSNQLARTMSGGEQQMLAIARGMMGLPKLLMVLEQALCAVHDETGKQNFCHRYQSQQLKLQHFLRLLRISDLFPLTSPEFIVYLN